MASNFKYDDYLESEAVKNLAASLQSHESNKVADWTGGTYGESLKEALNKINNRDKFSYDLNGDALYQQYKNQYITQGKMAMQDTMGQAAALTGGYGNSYASTAGNQAYQGYLQNLNNIVPELYQLAYDKYNQEGQDLLNQYSLLSDRYNTEYGEHRNAVADWNAQRDYLAGRYDSERNYDYSKYSDGRDFAFSDYQQGVGESQWQKDFDEAIRQYDEKMLYQKERDAISDAQWEKEFDEKVRMNDASLLAKYSDDDEEDDNTKDDGKIDYDDYKQEMKDKGYNDLEADLNTLIAVGAPKSKINALLRAELNEGNITTAQYQKLKEKYAPRGNTY